MIKIEEIKGVKGTITRNDVKVSIFVGQLITHGELSTLEISGYGMLKYTIDELEVVTKEYKEPVKVEPIKPKAEPVKTTKSGTVIK